MIKKLAGVHFLLLIIITLSLILRLYHLNQPNSYVFDEVYHTFTAKQYLLGNSEAWDWWTKAPPGVAYEWTHPPLAKELMAFSMAVFNSTDAWAWRLPGVLLGTLSIFLTFELAYIIFKDKWVALLSALIFSFDGLNFVLSRTGMNDVYCISFSLISIVFLLRKQYLLSALFWGLSISSKWTGIYLLPIYLIFLFRYHRINQLIYFLVIGPLVYLISYLPFFLSGNNFEQFKELQYQMFYYHTHLKATHDYSSPWWSWPLNLYPVWFYVNYSGDKIANIFASGNPAVFWSGSIAVVLTTLEFIKSKSVKLLLPLLGFFVFWLPWAFSPRIMFLYHFAPSVPFMSIILAYFLHKIYKFPEFRFLVYLIIFFIVANFVYFYPILIGLPMPKEYLKIFFSTNITKNPFLN